jgi:multidrug resistance efflux pump
MPEEKPKFELRSEEVKEILGHVPHWIIRWGMLVFLTAISLILIGSWVFKYPDIISTQILITTGNPPAHAISRADGRIMKLFVSDNESVTSGKVLAIIENPSIYDDILKLQLSLDFVKDLLSIDTIEISKMLPQGLSLGDIQSSYASFIKQCDDLNNFKTLGYHDQKIKSVDVEIKNYINYSSRLKKQSAILTQEVNLTENQYKRDSMLFRQGVISEVDLEKSRAILLQKRYALEQSMITIASNEIQIGKLEQLVMDIALQKFQEQNKISLQMKEALDNLLAEIALWEQRYLLKSSVDGVVSFTRIWSENQNVRAGEKVMSVIPQNQGAIIGKLNLPVKGSGKVKPGQQVNIKFDGYPYMEFGMVKGTVHSISLVAHDNLYNVQVNLNEGLRTNYEIDLEFNQEMYGVAEIITDDKRLLERVVYPVKALINKQRVI